MNQNIQHIRCTVTQQQMTSWFILVNQDIQHEQCSLINKQMTPLSESSEFDE